MLLFLALDDDSDVHEGDKRENHKDNSQQTTHSHRGEERNELQGFKGIGKPQFQLVIETDLIDGSPITIRGGRNPTFFNDLNVKVKCGVEK